VVSVRLEEDLIQRLDSLADRTGRSKGVYLRLALRAVLPTLEEYHWNQIAAQFEDGVIDRQFREIMTQTLNDRDEPEVGK
jgi:RHH-type rel operon transcriptional repressor/antitoxin RelB